METKIRELITKLNEASDIYHNGKDEIMSNKEWDDMLDELSALEKATGIIFPDSPTQNVGADNTDGKKEEHEFPALSLAKTKSILDLIKWANNKPIWMSWKLDGLTLVATYDNGKLSKLMTRGNGVIGTNITEKAAAINKLPLKIPYKGHLVVRGEALISYADFERINSEIEDSEKKYKNARNLASGTINLDDLDEIKRRNIQFVAFQLRYCDDSKIVYNKIVFDLSKWGERMGYLSNIGFCVVKRELFKPEYMQKYIDSFTEMVSSFEFPVDGLVICYDDWEYSLSGSVTSHHETRAGYAFKWKDETVETIITDIIWSASRTGLLNPVAVFEPVELCGTTVTKASLFNLSYVNEKDIKIGDHVTVFKANLIIPQIDKNLDAELFDIEKEGLEKTAARYNMPLTCPHCNQNLILCKTDKAMTVKCINAKCSAKLIGRLTHFCERYCMNIMGLSEAKLQNLIDLGIVTDIPSLLQLNHEYHKSGDIRLKNETLLSEQEGWGKKSVKELANGIENACKNATFIGFIHAMGIPNVGKGQAKLLKKAIEKWVHENPSLCNSNKNHINVMSLMYHCGYDFKSIDGFGDVITESLTKWINEQLYKPLDLETVKILEYITFVDTYEDIQPINSNIVGMTFVVTGDVHIFKNRKEIEAKIEELGGKLSGSVSKKTNYLINNDVNSTSGKNKKAKDLSIPIISEEDFCKLIGM